MGMILVICDETDTSAFWAAEALKEHGLSPIVVTGAELGNVESWRHTVGESGADCEIRFAGGWRLHSSETTGVLNRLVCVPWQWQRQVGGDDRAYALQEMSAFYLSWLYTLRGPIFNKPTPQGLCGNLRHPSAWTALGGRVGLPVRPYQQSAETDASPLWWGADSSSSANLVYVVGSSVIGPQFLVEPHREACLRLATAADIGLLGIEFEAGSEGGWRMCGVSVAPNLIHGGNALAAALAEEFTS